MRKVFEAKEGCFAKAFDNEPMFVLLARDVAAPATIREWCRLRCLRGKNNPKDAQIVEALAMADVMADEQEGWRKAAKQRFMEAEGITQQDIAETMPERP